MRGKKINPLTANNKRVVQDRTPYGLDEDKTLGISGTILVIGQHNMAEAIPQYAPEEVEMIND